MKYLKSIVAYIFIALGTMIAVNGEDTKRIDLLKTYCNDAKYTEVCWITAHNAFANSADGWLYRQQNMSFEEQYFYGVRSFMIDLYWYNANDGKGDYIALCHEAFTVEPTCFSTWGARGFKSPPTPVKTFFEIVKVWLETDSDAIITLHLESHLGSGSKGKDELNRLLDETGLKKYLFPLKLSIVEEWPTLREMRWMDQRLIIFSDNEDDGMLSVGSYRETQYNLSKFPNVEMREEERALAGTGDIELTVLNHFYPTSFVEYYDYTEINSYHGIAQRVNLFQEQEGRFPNFIAVDFVEKGAKGGVRKVVTHLNTLNFTGFSINPDE